jgi:murein DD-endopeptidase MepM/ murein hydrolase activator NlpD
MNASRALAGFVLAVTVTGVLPGAAVAHPLPAAVADARPAASDAARSRPVWSWPLQPEPRVVRPFDPPPKPWNPGHRGIDLSPGLAGVGASVLAVDDGVISHVGVIAGRGTVSVLHSGDIKSTYEPVSATVTYGQSVRRGQAIGTLHSPGSHCAPAACLHLGALRRQSSGTWDYFDPLFLLTSVEIVLLPR